MLNRWLIGLAAAVCVDATAMRAAAQSCDDFDPCTVSDMCHDGECFGTPSTSGSCDDGSDCTVNDRCTSDGCMGDPAPVGTSCSGGCGTCQSFTPFPIPGVPLQCSGDAANSGQACNIGSGSCFTGACQITVIPGVGGLAFCIPSPKVCPDTDGNPCTDNCNFQTGQCEKNAPKCFGNCLVCDPSTGSCEAGNDGAACDDFNSCTAQSSCQSGECVAGVPSAPTPTPTPSEGPTPTVPPTGNCAGDCNGDHMVTINELITGVNIALESSALSACVSFDTNGSGSVEVNELISGVNAALNGCA